MKQKDNQNINLLQNPLHISETSIYPINYIKILLQINKSGKIGTYFIKSINTNKLQIYKGLKLALIRYSIYSISKISIYENFRNNYTFNKKMNKTNNDFVYKLVLGGLSCGISQFIANPFDLLKIRYTSKNNKNNSVCNIINNIIKTNGFKGLWKGATPNISRAILVNLGEFVTYDCAKKNIKKYTGLNESPLVYFSSSICSGFTSALCCTPADVIKLQLMKINSPYSGVYDCLIKTIQNDGFMALYKGFLSIWLKLALSQIIFWTTYERLRTLNNINNF